VSVAARLAAAARVRDALGVRAALLAMVVFFGGSLPAYKIAGAAFGPATTNGLRFLAAAIVLTAVARLRLAGARGHWPALVGLGVYGVGLMAVMMAIGVEHSSATVASIVVGLEPVGVAVAGIALGGERPNAGVGAAIVLGLAGAVVASGAVTQPLGEVPVVGVALMLGTVATFSVYTARVRRASQGVHPLAVAAITQVGALAFALPASLYDLADGGLTRGPITARAVAAVLFLGVGSAFAYLLLCSVLAHQPASRVAVALYLIPVLGVAFSALVAGERLTGRDLAGGALVLGAVWVSERGRRGAA
jgi:drug/metabolite transporter (DMT)-like permease